MYCVKEQKFRTREEGVFGALCSRVPVGKKEGGGPNRLQNKRRRGRVVRGGQYGRAPYSCWKKREKRENAETQMRTGFEGSAGVSCGHRDPASRTVGRKRGGGAFGCKLSPTHHGADADVLPPTDVEIPLRVLTSQLWFANTQP